MGGAAMPLERGWSTIRPVMTFRTQVAARMAMMVISLIIVSGAALWGLHAQREDYSSALAGYEDLRELYEIGSNLAMARKLAFAESPDPRAVMREIQSAAARFQAFAPHVAGPRMEPIRADVRRQLADAQTRLWELITSGQGDVTAMDRPLDQLLRLISETSTAIRQEIQASEQAAHRKHQAALYSTAGICAALILVALGLGITHYRTVMRPLRRLNRSVHELTEGRMDHRADATGPEEFAQLARDFNTMADRLDALYRDLERKVDEKSRQLVRSERLASVGFLAAGVAHEINNPIGIIAGHAELALAELARSSPETALTGAREAFGVIAEEAFRCKAIVEKLLSLSRPGEESRKPVSPAALARSVIESLSALDQSRGRQVHLDARCPESVRVLGSEGELKQVMLNLLINATEATDATTGRIDVTVTREGDGIELAVADNGRGMTSEVRERIFEPFFTTRRGAARPGTGLGLSISHAIVAAHGGQLCAYSDGPGRGSRFVMRLPCLPEDAR